MQREPGPNTKRLFANARDSIMCVFLGSVLRAQWLDRQSRITPPEEK